MPLKRTCRIDEFGPDLVSCKCGWHYKEPQPGEYGMLSLRDVLLDRYNAHRAQAQQGAQADAA